ncbi:hypothetical protein CALVIDRAFT_528248 [Calocera viscosa TUFC12733]|uniref:rRNA-processing protein FYV7 n=1 Tax=Calocera viscosa (strain TUFC12733) TaxID=1330018 RepID=A0A167KYR6_CALVF|nr:hypothetical protein CALVIDRAFT_528248 [Calocera viscosa TUFC12733]
MAKTTSKLSRRGSDTQSDISQRKRKGPPKFQHLPHATAKKLKLQWVEKKKLQSQYFGKGQKRKAAASAPAEEKADGEGEGEEWENESGAVVDEEEEEAFDGFSDGMDEDEDEDVLHDSPDGVVDDDEDPENFRMRTPSIDVAQTGLYRGGTSLKRELELPEQRHRPVRVPSAARRPPPAKGYVGGSELGRVDRKGSVRRVSESSGAAEDVRRGKGATADRMERAREEREEAARRRARAKAAYAQDNLHTYKSDPLRRQANGNAKGHGRRGEKGKGQPDMRLRMNALLETIKKNVAPKL